MFTLFHINQVEFPEGALGLMEKFNISLNHLCELLYGLKKMDIFYDTIVVTPWPPSVNHYKKVGQLITTKKGKTFQTRVNTQATKTFYYEVLGQDHVFKRPLNEW